MKKILTTLTFLIVSAIAGMAQVTNGGLEQWSTAIWGTEEPDGWQSGNIVGLAGGDTLSCFKTTDRTGGNNACKLRSFHSSLLDINFPGALFQVTGVSSRPETLRMMYKAYMQGADTCTVIVALYKGETSDPDNQIGYGELIITQNQGTYTAGIVPIEYATSEMPDSMTIEIYAGSGVAEGTELYVDDIKVSSNPVSVNTISADQPVKVYPNPATDELNIDVLDNYADGILIINDVTGKEMLRQHIASLHNLFNTAGWQAGFYTYRVVNNTGGGEQSGKILITH